MSKNYWSETNAEEEFDPIASLLAEWTDLEDEEEEFRSEFFQGLSGRRRKAAFVLMLVWLTVIGLHLLSWGYWLVTGFTGILALQAIRLVTAKPDPLPEALTDEALENAPTVSLLVAAKNEEAVIARLVKQLCSLDYPSDKYEVWIVDDHSTDKTGMILDRLAEQFPQLQVVHRPANAGGGKSGALNEVLTSSKGAIIGVFDADASVTPDLLRWVSSMFAKPEIGAVQVRKAIVNGEENFWTKGQAAEMALDSCFQQHRNAIGGIGELRGNGQFVRRSALQRCGGWNEETITDDLDLTMRLHLDGWQIGFLPFPAVGEEGVTSAISLWHQRNRWAEGGYQRYLDYWRLIFNQPMSLKKRIDLLSFILIQYLLPTAAVPDLVMTITRHRLPVLAPLTGLMLSLSFWGMFKGLVSLRLQEKLSFRHLLEICWQSTRGMIYMLHWLVVMPATTARMSVRPKRLKWVKTIHEGTGEESFEF